MWVLGAAPNVVELGEKNLGFGAELTVGFQTNDSFVLSFGRGSRRHDKPRSLMNLAILTLGVELIQKSTKLSRSASAQF